MGTTSDFVKLRSKGTPKVGEWNINYKDALAAARKNGKWLVCCWSNGDKCGYCVSLEKVFMTSEFKNWLKTQDAYFVFQYSGDKDNGQTVHDLVYRGTGLKYYPGLRIQKFDPTTGKITMDLSIEGNKLRSNKAGDNGAKAAISWFDATFKKVATKAKDTAPVVDKTNVDYKIRFNEKLTVKKVNAILDAIDKNAGYCPCQMQCPESKCHCKDFLENKKIGEPCICNIFVKVKK